MATSLLMLSDNRVLSVERERETKSAKFNFSMRIEYKFDLIFRKDDHIIRIFFC